MSEYLLVALILLACPVGMGLMVWWMVRYASQSPKGAAPVGGLDAREAEVIRLRAELDQLKAAQRESSESGGRPRRAP